LKQIIKRFNLEAQVSLLGFRRDIIEICKSSDLFAFPSLREGLSVALMEAMASGLPIVCSNIRGNSDLVIDGKGGFLIDPNSIVGYAQAIARLYKSDATRRGFVQYNSNIINNYSVDSTERELSRIYETDVKG